MPVSPNVVDNQGPQQGQSPWRLRQRKQQLLCKVTVQWVACNPIDSSSSHNNGCYYSNYNNDNNYNIS